MFPPTGGKQTDKSVAALTPASASPFAGPLPADGGLDAGSRFTPGTVFAGRYRMITPIGRGATGEVWRAADLTLGLEVALKVIEATDEAGREGILKEVRLARQITHPAVCRVFDVGESDDCVFYSMELVPGEDLATLLGRIGRLPPEKVLEIGLHLGSGLAAAHAQGVLHRDLKPGNVLIDEDGQVRITDFGIAITRSESGAGVLAGTPGYMAPEQRAGLPISEATDVFALGVLLYELLVGQRPFTGGRETGRPPVRPSALVPGVPPALEAAILRALSTDPRQRPASAMALVERLRMASAAAGRTRWLWPAAAMLLAIAIAALAVLFRGAGERLTEHDTLVLADFMNTTADPVFDRALKVALAVALEQSPFLKVFPDERIRETLRLMERPEGEPVTRAVARDVARRERLKALVSGSIGSFGRNYVITLEALHAETGDVMAREQVEVASRDEVLGALGAASARLRERLGESLASVTRFDVPLPRATTASLEALHAYALALDEGRLNPRREAIPHLRRALEIDPDFAMAQALLSGVYANTGQSGLAPEYSKKAFDLRDRVSERERFFISWRYFVDAVQAWDRALPLAESWAATYPREAFAFNSLGLASAAFGRHDRAVEAFREAIRVDPGFVPPYGNLAGSLVASNRYDEAAGVLEQARARRVAGTALRRTAFILPFIAGNTEAMASALVVARSSDSVAGASIWEARAAVFDGRFLQAHDLYERGIASALTQQLPEAAAQWSSEAAEAYALAGDCGEARRVAGRALELSRDNFTLERVARTLALCGDAARVAALDRELAERFPDATLTVRLQRPVAAAVLALQRGDARRALELLEPVRSYDYVPAAELWPPYVRGAAHLAQGDAPAAAMQFQAVLTHRGAAPTSPLYALAQLGAARSAASSRGGGVAREAYDRFLTLWKDADAGLPALEAARREAAQLR